MVIAPPCLVEIHVELFDLQGNLLERTEAPLAYLHGAGDIFPALEARLEGHEAGDRLTVDLEPAQAFGDYDAERVHLVARQLLGVDCGIGMQVEGVPGQRSDGHRYRITDLAPDVAVLDGNHPYAGIDLRFEIRVVKVTDVDPTGIEELDVEEARPPGFLRVAPARE
ncbi:MAG TPA: peptidylprolyl isomerase [Burkholderiaceae bacterium]|nr:peptidylprolyl isomerase [Burkholderiaceae bacterium]